MPEIDAQLAQRHFPLVAEIRREQQVRVRRHRQPGVALDLLVELAGAPTRIAPEHSEFGDPLADDPWVEPEVDGAEITHDRAPRLAGLTVEPGESLEDAVVREVREEVGVAVGNVRYWGSQPWPFPHSLMVGFTAEWESGEIEIDPSEIVDAQWFRRDALPAVPPRVSIARKIIDAWLESAE